MSTVIGSLLQDNRGACPGAGSRGGALQHAVWPAAGTAKGRQLKTLHCFWCSFHKQCLVSCVLLTSAAAAVWERIRYVIMHVHSRFWERTKG